MRDYLRYRVIEDGVHEFVFLKNDLQAVDFFYDTIGQVFDLAPDDKLVRYIVDWSDAGAPSMNYMYLKVQEWGRKHRHVAPGRGVIFFNQRGFAAIGNALATVLMQMWGDRIRLRFVHVNQRDEGLAWLMENEQQATSS